MKKKSANEIQKRYGLSAQDRKNIAETVTAMGLKESVGLLKDSGKSLQDAAEAIKEAAVNNNVHIERMLNNHFTLIRDILKKLTDQKKNYECDVKRNKSGFISKIYFKQI